MLKFLSILSFSIYLLPLQAQQIYERYRPNPLDSFLRKQADTTLVFQLNMGGTIEPPIHYLSKKGDTITLYRHGINFKYNVLIPSAIRDKIYIAQRDWEISKDNTITLNRFFNVLDVPQDELRLLWEKVVALKPNQMRDDVIEGYGCPVVKNEGNMLYDRNIYDGSGIIFNILTRSEVQHFYFYAPSYYLEKCPERESRKTILAIQTLLTPYCKFWNH